jgi:hypothetical protein
MKLNSFVLLAILLLFSLELMAENNKDFSGVGGARGVVLKKNSDGIGLLSKKSGLIFSLSVGDSSLEDFSVYESNGRFSVLREGRGSSKDKTIIRVDEDFKVFEYIYIDSQIDIVKGRKFWAGFHCLSSGYKLQGGERDIFEESFDELCRGKALITGSSHEFLGADTVFFMPLITPDGVKEIKIISLDAGLYDNVNIFDFGCVEGCKLTGSEINFTGRVGRSKIKMSLKTEGYMVSGYYYYDKFKKNIYVDGVMRDGLISLYAKDKTGKILERFEGEVKDGVFSGAWTDVVKSRVLLFRFYISII